MLIEYGPHPAFSWSISRHRKLEECGREYYFQYYASHNGWRADASELSRTSYILKNLTTLPITLGQVVHERASEIATAIREGQSMPDLADLYRRSAATMNAVYASQDLARFERRPKAVPMLQERYHRRPIASDRLVALRAKLERCLNTLHEAPLWSDVVRAAGHIHLPRATESITTNGVAVYGAPDLLYCVDDRWTIVDWKTGQCDDVELQLAVSSVYVCERYAVEPPVNACAVFLDTGDSVQREVGHTQNQHARGRIRDSMWEMRRLLQNQDEAVNAPLPASAFQPRPDVSACAYCRFMSICDAEERMGPF